MHMVSVLYGRENNHTTLVLMRHEECKGAQHTHIHTKQTIRRKKGNEAYAMKRINQTATTAKMKTIYVLNQSK